MHGHQLRLLAEQEHVHFWTDFKVGGVYGGLKRLLGEGLIEVVRTERHGNRPERQIVDITTTGREVLAKSTRKTLEQFRLLPDSFDLALARLDPNIYDELPTILRQRRGLIGGVLRENDENLTAVSHLLTRAETHILHHHRFRLQAELDWLDSVIDDLPAVLHDELTREVNPDVC